MGLQGFSVTVLEGCYEYGSKKVSLATDDIGIQGNSSYYSFSFPYSCA